MESNSRAWSLNLVDWNKSLAALLPYAAAAFVTQAMPYFQGFDQFSILGVSIPPWMVTVALGFINDVAKRYLVDHQPALGSSDLRDIYPFWTPSLKSALAGFGLVALAWILGAVGLASIAGIVSLAAVVFLITAVAEFLHGN